MRLNDPFHTYNCETKTKRSPTARLSNFMQLMAHSNDSNNALRSDLTNCVVVVEGIMSDADTCNTDNLIPDEAVISPLSADGPSTAAGPSPIPIPKKVDSFTCSCSSAGDGSFDGGMASSLDEPSPSPLSVDMFSRFATAYTYPIDGDDDDESEDELSCNSVGSDAKVKSEKQGRSRSAYSLDGEMFCENEDDDQSCDNNDTRGGSSVTTGSKLKTADATSVSIANQRHHRRGNSLPASLDMASDALAQERKMYCSPEKNALKAPIDSSCTHTRVTPSPPLKKSLSHRRSRTLPVMDLSGVYDNKVPATAMSSEQRTPPQRHAHRRVVSAHTPLGDMMSLSGSDHPSLSSVSSACPRPRAGLPPRPNAAGRPSPALRKQSLQYERLGASHRRTHSAPMVPSPREGGSSATSVLRNKPSALHLRSASYGNFKALRDASESLYMPRNASPDPQLLGQRPRHQRGASLDSRTTRSTDSNVSSTSEEGGISAEQYWNNYYEKKKMKKSVVKDEIKFRLGKAVPKALSSRLSSRPELRRANSAKFV